MAAMPYPVGTTTNDAGHLEIGGCDVIELAREFGTPAYLFATAEMRNRARAYQRAFAAHTAHFEVLYASKALPVTAAYRLFAEEGLSVDVASGGELTMALTAGFDPAKIYMHGNNKTDVELVLASRSGVGHLILDSFDEIDRCERVLQDDQDVLVRVTPGIKPSTHSFIQTGQLDSKFGFGLEDGTAAKAIERVLASDRLNLVGLHFHIGSQIFEIEPFRLAVEALGELRRLAAADRGVREPQGPGGQGCLRREREDPDRARPFPGRHRRRHHVHDRHGQGNPRGPHLRRG